MIVHLLGISDGDAWLYSGSQLMNGQISCLVSLSIDDQGSRVGGQAGARDGARGVASHKEPRNCLLPCLVVNCPLQFAVTYSCCLLRGCRLCNSPLFASDVGAASQLLQETSQV